MRTRKLKVIAFYVVGWSLSLMAFSIIRGVGTTENGPVDFDLGASLFLSFPIGLVFGAISGGIQTAIEKQLYKKATLCKLLFVKGLLMLFFLMTMTTAYYFSYRFILGSSITFSSIAFNGYVSLVIYCYWILVDISLTFIRQVDQMLGKGTLRNLLLGQYYMPTEKFRIFMFLDLQSSTAIAEKLGHKAYSAFIQECFRDLEVVDEYKAEVYQYLGDGVVLTWDKYGGLDHNNCISAFYAFKKRLDERAAYYQSQYGILPKFKAGMNAGIVTCTEVGSIKKEIAYHGDAINVAARIQEKCNAYSVELLITDELLTLLTPSHSFAYQKRGNLQLKGKKEHTIVYAVASELRAEIAVNAA